MKCEGQNAHAISNHSQKYLFKATHVIISIFSLNFFLLLDVLLFYFVVPQLIDNNIVINRKKFNAI